MNKKEYIRRYGIEAFEKIRQQSRDCNAQRREEYREGVNAKQKEWKENNPEKVIANSHETSHKGGKYYDQKLQYLRTGVQGERNSIRGRHGRCYRLYKRIIAPKSQIHHEWIPNTADFRGVALVEKYQHQYGIIDVIQILEGKITLLTEGDIRKRGAAVE